VTKKRRRKKNRKNVAGQRIDVTLSNKCNHTASAANSKPTTQQFLFLKKPERMIGLVLLFLMSVCFGFIRSSPTEQFVDESGRQVVFHGVNAVFKQAPWLPLPNASAPFNASLNENDFQLLSGWGFNFVRLGAMWPGLMPWNASLPDPSYLQALDEIVSLARKYGIFVLLDLHQDLLSPFFCGEGAPDYLVPRPDLIAKFPLPIGMPYKTVST
jgi:endoglycosylceramidase